MTMVKALCRESYRQSTDKIYVFPYSLAHAAASWKFKEKE